MPDVHNIIFLHPSIMSIFLVPLFPTSNKH